MKKYINNNYTQKKNNKGRKNAENKWSNNNIMVVLKYKYGPV